jgi:uncharacterized protein RhaS with RHS repeats
LQPTSRYDGSPHYDTPPARFISDDPIGLAGGINPYAYAGNDPVNGADPFGLEPCTEEQLAGGAIQANFSDGNVVCKEGTSLPPIVTTAPSNPSGPPIVYIPALPQAPPGVGLGGAVGPAPKAPPSPTTAEVCAADIRQAALSTTGTILGVGALGYGKGLVTLATSETAWEVPAVTNAFARNAAFLPSFMALKQALGSGGTPTPFTGFTGRVYQALKMVPGFGAGMEAGEAFESCRRVSR